MVSSQQGYANTTTDMKGNTAAVNEAQSNLPLPEQPPVASDFNSSDARTVNVGSGGQEAGISSGACRVIKRTTRALRILRARTMDILRRMTPAASSRWLLVEN
jgi:hypothetical protein